MRKEFKYDVFISYAREDRQVVSRLHNDLVRLGIRCWFDLDALLPGQQWKNAISEAIRGSRFFFAVLSQNAVGKWGYVQSEINQALEILKTVPRSEIYLVPIRIESCEPGFSELKDYNYLDLFENWENGIERLRRLFNACKIAPVVDVLSDEAFLRTAIYELKYYEPIRLFLLNHVDALPEKLRMTLRATHIRRYVNDLSASLEMHFAEGGGKLDPATQCIECCQRGSIVHGVVVCGGRSLSDDNLNYFAWCKNCFWAWYWFEANSRGEFDYSTNTYDVVAV
jgi:hypothetical protein